MMHIWEFAVDGALHLAVRDIVYIVFDLDVFEEARHLGLRPLCLSWDS